MDSYWTELIVMSVMLLLGYISIKTENRAYTVCIDDMFKALNELMFKKTDFHTDVIENTNQCSVETMMRLVWLFPQEMGQRLMWMILIVEVRIHFLFWTYNSLQFASNVFFFKLVDWLINVEVSRHSIFQWDWIEIFKWNFLFD